ncbi:hypothetical protein D9613_010618 [Agrocybe pediades]|uniref:Uncharacterized protein n=1 Tax=Agrocybe pediades TaxID=84607 RepID=A0A8H4QG21_9AGAR|nr:hypothetical protein D9613_010618 [Agrocybe pediades]
MPFSLKPTSSSASSKTKDAQRTTSSSKPSSKSRASNKPSDNSKANEKAAENNKASKPQGSFLKALKKIVPCASKKAMKKNFDDVEVVDLTVDAAASRPGPSSVVEQTRSDDNTARRVGERRVDASKESRKGSPPPPPFSPKKWRPARSLETGIVAQVNVEEACDDSQDVVVCYALSPEDEEERTPQAVAEFGISDTVSSVCEDQTLTPIMVPGLFITPPAPLSTVSFAIRQDHQYLSPLPPSATGFDTIQVVFFKEENTDDEPTPDAAQLDRLDEEEDSQDSLIARQDLLGPMPDAGHSHLFDEEEEDAAMVAQRALAAAQEFEDLLNGF